MQKDIDQIMDLVVSYGRACMNTYANGSEAVERARAAIEAAITDRLSSGDEPPEPRFDSIEGIEPYAAEVGELYRQLRIVEYLGERDAVEVQIRRSINGTMLCANVQVTAATISDTTGAIERVLYSARSRPAGPNAELKYDLMDEEIKVERLARRVLNGHRDTGSRLMNRSVRRRVRAMIQHGGWSADLVDKDWLDKED